MPLSTTPASRPTASAASVPSVRRSGLASPLPSGCTRLLKKIKNERAAGSIQTLVPVKPVWPNDAPAGNQRPRGPEKRGVDVPAEAAAVGAVVLHARHLGHGRSAEDADAVELPAAEDHAAEAGEVGRRGEKSGVAGDAVHKAGRGVVHDATEHLAVGELGRGDAGEFGGGRQEAGVDHVERLKNLFGRVGIEAEAADDAHEFAEHDEVDVAVDKGAARSGCGVFLCRRDRRRSRNRTRRASCPHRGASRSCASGAGGR
jgi:hypothetical protein